MDKNKIHVMKSIMSNPKLARTFADALKSPLGSTKRDNARSTLSIIGKLGGANGQGGPGYYGMGGPSAVTPTLFSPSYESANNPSYKEDYGNMMIFPAAPKFKVTGTSPTGGQGRGGPNDMGSFNSSGGFDFTPSSTQSAQSSPTPPPAPTPSSNPIPWGNLGSGNNIGGNSFGSGAPITQGQGDPDPFYLNSILGATGDTLNAIGGMFNSAPSPYPLRTSGLEQNTSTPAGAFPSAKDLVSSWGNLSSAAPVSSGSQTTSTSGAGSTSTTGTNQTDTSGNTGSTSQYGSATTTVTKLLGGVDPSTSFATYVQQHGAASLLPAFKTNEGGSLSGVQNNPYNIKFNNLPGQIDSGVKASDGGTYASYATTQAADQGAVDMINAIASGKTGYGASPTLGNVIDRWTNTWGTSGPTSSTDTSGDPSTSGAPDYSTASGITTAAQSAVSAHTGPGSFALGVANSKFNGGLQDYLTKIDSDLKTQFGLNTLEDQLTTLKNEKGNIIPTLQTYMSSRDQYLKSINQMIANVDDSMSHADMSDPLISNQLNNYRTYLVNLQGMQNQRYGNFLNGAIANYNTDVQNVQDNYDNVYKRYTEAMTQASTLAQADYNNLFNAASDLYNSLDQAPTKLASLTLLQQQAQAAYLQTIANANQVQNGAPIFKDMTQFDPVILDTAVDPVTQKTTKILKPSSEINLADMYKVANQSQLGPALTVMVTSGMKAGIEGIYNKSSLSDSLKTITDYRKELTQLAADPNYGSYANQLAPSLSEATASVLSRDVTSKVADYRSAIQDLVAGTSGWFGSSKPGLGNQTAWTTKYTGKIDPTVLSALYDGVKALTVDASGNPTAYGKNPMTIFTTPSAVTSGKLSDVTDTALANAVSSIVSTVWNNEIAQSAPQSQTQ